MQNQDLSFTKLYTEVRGRHPNIVEISDAALKQLEVELDRAKRSQETPFYVAAALAALFILTTYPLFFAHALTFAKRLQPEVIRLLTLIDLASSPARQIACAIFILSAIFYTIILPARWGISREVVQSTRTFMENHLRARARTQLAAEQALEHIPQMEVNRSSTAFIALVIIANHAVILAIIAALHAIPAISRQLINYAIFAWLIAPLAVACVIPGLTMSLVLIILADVIPVDESGSQAKHALITQRLLILLRRLDDVGSLAEFSDDHKGPVLDSIRQIATDISQMYKGHPASDGAMIWSRQQMHLACDNFMVLTSWVCLPQAHTLECLKERILLYSNIFLSGRYSDLPREKLDETRGFAIASRPPGLSRLVSLMSFGLYLATPILLLVFALAHWGINLPPLTQSALVALYVVWVSIGALHFAERFAPDARTSLLELLKIVLGRK